MKYFKANIEANGEWPPNEDNAAMLSMELIFTIGDNWNLTAGETVAGTLRDLNLSRYMEIRDFGEISQDIALQHLSNVIIDDTCPIHHVIHKDGVMVGDIAIYPQHEYELETKTHQQKYPRTWRMGYIGRRWREDDSQLQFNARGPDRSTGKRYAGDVIIPKDRIIRIREVPHDPAKRSVPGKR